MNLNLCGWGGIRFVLAGIGLLTVAWSSSAHADVCSSDPNNIVQDCNFAATSPWSFSGDAGTDASIAPSDAFLSYNNSVSNGEVSQNLTLQPGQTYSITFELAADQTTINNAADYDLSQALFGSCLDDGCFDASITLSFDGTQLDQILADNGDFNTADSYASFTYSPVASTSSGTLDFLSAQDPNAGYTGTWYLDEVQVDCTTCGPSTPVPEPDDLVMFLTAFVGWYSLFRLRRDW